MPRTLRQIAVSALMLCALVVGVQPAAATQANRTHDKVRVASKTKNQNKQGALCKQANKLRKLVIKKHGKRKPGRDICKYGMTRTKQATRSDKLDYKQTLHRIAYPPPPPVVAPAPAAPSPAQPSATGSSVGGGSLSAIAQCESGGSPSAVSPNGLYRGKYQFDQSTWESVGGTGDPAAAPEAEQDARAQTLYSQRGTQPWPVCGQ